MWLLGKQFSAVLAPPFKETSQEPKWLIQQVCIWDLLHEELHHFNCKRNKNSCLTWPETERQGHEDTQPTCSLRWEGHPKASPLSIGL